MTFSFFLMVTPALLSHTENNELACLLRVVDVDACREVLAQAAGVIL